MSPRKLTDLLADIDCQPVNDAGRVEVSSITADSRCVEPGSLFVALAGISTDGHNYLRQAVAAGAVAVLVNSASAIPVLGVPVVKVVDTARALGKLAASFYGKPAEKMTMIAITGTNGKTTCAYLLEKVVAEAGGRCGVIGTVNYRFAAVVKSASHTTPDPVKLQGLLAEMADAGISHVIIEVSSHALEQGRVEGLKFDVALFTNLSRDHLDFHGDMERYFAAKKILFMHHLKEKGHAVVVVGEGTKGYGARLVEILKQEGVENVIPCGKGGMVTSSHEKFSLAGIGMQVDVDGEVGMFTSPLVGEFNVRNILAVLGVAKALDVPVVNMRKAIEQSTGAPGRMESVELSGNEHAKIIVDYAHTPDALENVLKTIKPLSKGRVFVVFGCGGDRDKGKRPMMGTIAVQFADVAIATSDNPRTENPCQILTEIEAGMKESGGKKGEVEFLQGQGKEYLVIASRQQAIACAINLANKNDVVLISGKGHEAYQHTSSGKVHFDDRLVAKEELEKVWGKAVGAA